MKRESLATHAWCLQLAIAALFVVGSLAVGTPALADVDVRFDIGNAPRAPRFYFHARPHRWYDRTSGVYVIDDPYVGDSDAFQYGGYYWLFSDGYWYRSRTWRGGFRVVEPQYVPTAIYSVPSQRWHNHPSYASWHNHRNMGRRGWRNRDMDTQNRDNQDRHRSQY